MVVSPYLRPLGIAAAVLGTLQGLLWTVLAIMAILLSTGEWEPKMNFEQQFEWAAYVLFFSNVLNVSAVADDFIFTGDVVLGFSCFYVIVSYLWAISSMVLLWICIREKYQHTRLCSFAWCSLTGLLTVVDIVLVIILAIDLEAVENSSFLDDSKFTIRLVLGTVMSLAARGYILLIVNVVLIYFLYKIATQTPPPQSPLPQHRPYIDAYQDTSAFSWHSNANVNRLSPSRGANSNSGFIPDDNIVYHRSVSQQQAPLRRFVPSADDSNLPGRPQRARATAPPREQPPYIPPPDYDIPALELERMPRSALRTRSYYR